MKLNPSVAGVRSSMGDAEASPCAPNGDPNMQSSIRSCFLPPQLEFELADLHATMSAKTVCRDSLYEMRAKYIAGAQQ
jgi:hypothetical protein